MDGAIADGEGEPYLLVATTDNSPIRNLTKNLESYLENRRPRRKVVMATSTALTQKRRQNLNDRAAERGFVMVQLYEQRAIADRLYRDSQWTQELLGITGRPSALSAIPRTRRPLREDVELVGRDADLKWLHETSGDRVIVGQPGSGKTYLALQLVREGRALFLADDDPGHIANACRDLEPEIVVVDDAHADLEVLDQLRHLRQEIGADFEILATTWPHAEDQVAEALGGLTKQSIRRLELLTRAEILVVLRSVGVRESEDDPDLGELVNQAANKPGLAVLLGSLWLRGELRDILTGRAIQRSLIPSLERVLGWDPTQVLGCFALGGDAGMEMEQVRAFLRLDREVMHQRTTQAAQGGILKVHRDQMLSVEPEPLRSALIGEVFFRKPEQGPSLPWQGLLASATSQETAIEALVRAAWRGAEIPREKLEVLIKERGSLEAWQGFALLGESEAKWVGVHYPGPLEDVARSLLVTVPRYAVEHLLRRAATNREAPLHSRPRHPLRILQEWVQAIPDPRQHQQPTKEALNRRELLLATAKALEEDCSLAFRAGLLALDPRMRSTRATVTGTSVAIRSGVLPPTTVPELLKYWGALRDSLPAWTSELWSELENMLQQWLYPATMGRELSEDVTDRYRDFARQVIRDLAAEEIEAPGLALALTRLAKRAGISVDVEVDPAFRTLFPLEGLDDVHQNQEEYEEAARALARQWVKKPANEVAERLASYQAEVSLFLLGSTGWRARPAFLREVASCVENPAEWLMAFIEHELDSSWLSQLLDRVIEEERDVVEIAQRCLEDDRYRWLGVEAILRSENIPPCMLDGALMKATPQLIETACMRREVPMESLRHVLVHSREAVAGAAAIGEWLADPQGQVRSEIKTEWREAVLRVGETERPDSDLDRHTQYWMKEILGTNQDLAFDWLKQRIEDADGFETVSEAGLYAAAIRTLNNEQRLELLEQHLKDDRLAGYLVSLLLDDSSDLYKHLLARNELQRRHLAPLEGHVPDAAWSKLAKLALEAGYKPSKIAEGSFHPSAFGMSYSGSGVEHWSQWTEGFRDLLEGSEGKLLEVAKHGLQEADKRVEEARQQQRQRELKGYF